MADAGAAELPEDNVVDGAAAQVHVKDEAGVVSTVRRSVGRAQAAGARFVANAANAAAAQMGVVPAAGGGGAGAGGGGGGAAAALQDDRIFAVVTMVLAIVVLWVALHG